MARIKGRLIAIDGCAGSAVSTSARMVARALREATGSGGVSPWDASGIFTDLIPVESDIASASARTLTLLYAADLAFRVRWHIQPSLEAGEAVVAAPYVESAKAFAIAAGLPKKWLDELFAFAPKPAASYRVGSRGVPVTSGTSGYLEWYGHVVGATHNGRDPGILRKKSEVYLAELQRRGRCRLLNARELSALLRDPRWLRKPSR